MSSKYYTAPTPLQPNTTGHAGTINTDFTAVDTGFQGVASDMLKTLSHASLPLTPLNQPANQMVGKNIGLGSLGIALSTYATGVQWRGIWQFNHAISRGDVIVDGVGNVYYAVLNYNSGPTLQADLAAGNLMIAFSGATLSPTGPTLPINLITAGGTLLAGCNNILSGTPAVGNLTLPVTPADGTVLAITVPNSWTYGAVNFTVGANGITPGEQFQVAGVTPATYNGTYNANVIGNVISAVRNTNPGAYTSGGTLTGLVAPSSITAASWQAGVVLFTIGSNNFPSFTPGATFTVAGVTPAAYNGTYTAIGAPASNSTVVAAALASNPGAYSSGGTVTSSALGSYLLYSVGLQPGASSAGAYNYFYLNKNVVQAGQTFTVTGVTPAAYNGTYVCSANQGLNTYGQYVIQAPINGQGPMTLYWSQIGSGTLPNSNILTQTLPSSEVFKTTSYTLSNEFGPVLAKGGSAATSTSTPLPAGTGFLFDTTALEGQTIAAGAWTFNFKASCTVFGGDIINLHLSAWIYNSNSGIYTQIAGATAAAINLANVATAYTKMNSTSSSTTFGSGDKLYLHITADSSLNGNLTGDTVSIYMNGGANELITTPTISTTPGAWVSGGTLTPTYVYNISTAAWYTGIAEFVSAGNTAVQGVNFTVAGVVPSAYNGTYACLEAGNTVLASLAANPDTYSSGGTLTPLVSYAISAANWVASGIVGLQTADGTQLMGHAGTQIENIANSSCVMLYFNGATNDWIIL